MKLSDVKGERVFDVIADCIIPIANIAADPEASRMFRRGEKLPEGQDKRTAAIERLKKSMPVLLKKHKRDIIAILSTIEGVSKKSYSESLNIEKLIIDMADLMSDEVFLGLFPSAQRKTDENSFGSAPENTEEQEVQ